MRLPNDKEMRGNQPHPVDRGLIYEPRQPLKLLDGSISLAEEITHLSSGRHASVTSNQEQNNLGEIR